MFPKPRPTTGAEAFARMLDGKAEVRSWDVPDLDDLPELIALTQVIANVQAPSLRPEFSSDLRARLIVTDPVAPREPERPLAESEAEIIDLAARRKRRATKRAFTAAAIGSIVLGTAGIAAAAQSALPGSPLYGMKRAIEGVESSFATNDRARAQDYLDQASTRLSEIQDLLKTGDTSNVTLIQQTLQAFFNSASQGTNLLLSNYQRSGNPADLSAIQTFTTKAASQLDAVAPQLSPQARPQMLQAAALIADVNQQSQMLCPTCASLPALPEQIQQDAAASNGASLASLLPTTAFTSASAPVPTVPTTTSTTTPKRPAATQPTTPPSTSKTTSPKPSTPALPATPTNVLGKVLDPILTPVGNILGGVVATTTGTVSGLTQALGGK